MISYLKKLSFVRWVIGWAFSQNAPDNPQPASKRFPPIYTVTHDKGRVRVTRGYCVETPIGEVCVQRNTITDGASIPRIAWPFIGCPHDDEILASAIVHDVLCMRAWINKDYEARVIADAVLFWMLKENSVSYWKRTAMYVAVRFCGRYFYHPNILENYQELAATEDFDNDEKDLE